MAASLKSEEGEVGFQIAPMVDVVFVLMLFFMACAGFQRKEKELRVALPGPAGPPLEVAITIDISADGQVIANDQSFGMPADKTLPALRRWIKATRSFGDANPIFLRPNPATRHERIMDVLNALHAVGIEKVTFS